MKSNFAFLNPLLLLICGMAGFGMGQPERALEAPFEPITERIHHRDVVVFGRDVVLKKDEVSHDLVVIGGNAVIDGTVAGDLVSVFGSVKINGKVERGMVVVLGSADLASTAEIDREVFILGGKLNLDPGARIRGDRREIVLGNLLPDLQWVAEWFTQGFLRARPLPPRLDWVWIVTAIYALICFLAAALFGRPVQACVNALEAQPAGSFFVGVLSLILFGPLVFLLIVSVAGIFVVPFLFLTFATALFFGNLVIYRTTGLQLGRGLNLEGLQRPAVSLLVGLAIFMLLYMVPIIGFVVMGVATVWGLGAVLMATFSGFRREAESTAVMATAPVILSEPSLSASASQTAPPPIAPSAGVITLARVGFWRRLWATLLDFVLLGLLIPITGPVFVLIWTAYFVAMWTWKGTTIGGIVMGIKIVRLDGQPMNFAVALVRSLSSFFSAVVLFLGFFWAGWDREKQAWHDKIAGTAVVKVPKGMALI